MRETPKKSSGAKPENESHITAERLEREGTRLSADDLSEVGDKLRLRAAVVYEIIREEGEEELARAPRNLWWSGIAAGLSIGFSVLGEAVLRAYLPDLDWRHLVENLGYGLGFVIVILARQQLFTENTLTAVLPAISAGKRRTYWRVLRLWGIVLLANVVGTVLFGSALASGLFLTAPVFDAAPGRTTELTVIGWRDPGDCPKGLALICAPVRRGSVRGVTKVGLLRETLIFPRVLAFFI